MTLNDYTLLIQSEVDDTSNRAKNVIERAVKDVYQEIIKHTYKWLLSTTTNDRTATAGIAIYTPSEFIELVAIHYKSEDGSNFNRLTPITQEIYNNRYINNDSSTPTKYFLNGLDYQLVAPPADLGTIRETYYATQDELTGVQVSIIPDHFINVVLLGAIARFKAYEQLPDAREYTKKYQGRNPRKMEGALGDMIEELSNRQQQGKYMRPTLW